MIKITKQDIITHLNKELAIEKNALVWLHSSITGLGILEDGINTITDAFSEVLSEGVLIIPTFSYSWNNGECYNSQITECNEMGWYAANAWSDLRFQRNNNPNFSVAFIDKTDNKECSDLLLDDKTAKTCFGKGSVFDAMNNLSKSRPGYILLFGGAHNDVVFRSTFLHFVEEKVGVPYRYLKNFHSPKNNKKSVEQYVRYFTESEYRLQTGKESTKYKFPIKESYKNLGNDLINEGLIKKIDFGYSQTKIVQIHPFCKWLESKIEQNPEYLLY